jgi:SNF2 family DNA or RNA helicase
MITSRKGKFYFPIGEYPSSPPYARINSSCTEWYLPVTPETIQWVIGRPMDVQAKRDVDEMSRLLAKRDACIQSLNTEKGVDFIGYDPPPYWHQSDAISRMLGTEYAALCADCGLGKTYIILNLLQEMRKRGELVAAFILCPSSLVEEVWIESTEKMTSLSIFNFRQQKSVKIDKGKYRLQYVQPEKPYDIYVVNYEQIANRYQDFIKVDYNVFVCDESTRIKNRDAIKNSAAIAMRDKAKYCWLMSGSMAPNGPEDYWNQFNIMDGGASLGREHWLFMEMTHTARHPYDREKKKYNEAITFWEPRPEGVQYVKERTRPLMLVYKIKDCIDLPEMKFITMKTELTAKQRKAYDELKDELCTVVDGEYVVAKNAVSALPKFSQITGGFVKNDQDEIMAFPENPKMELLLEVIESIDKDEKFIIWAWFQHEVEAIYEALSKHGKKNNYSVQMLYGGMQNKVSSRIKEFKGGSRGLVANQAVLGHGHSFTFCHYMIFYSNPFDWELRFQAERRLPRIGQKDAMFVYDLVCKDTVDIKLLNVLHNKEAMHNFLTAPKI